jgi:cation:H+ antiporter
MVDAVIPAMGWVGISSPLLIALYIVAMRTVFQYERRRIAKFVQEIAEDASPKGISLRTALIRYAINAAVTVTAAIFLPAIASNSVTYAVATYMLYSQSARGH